jgi:hypothetical protein
MSKHKRECIELCRAEGLTVIGSRNRGKHWAVTCAEGEIIFPSTPSDRRWRYNARAFVRRLGS